jgi:hypothetical protein
MLENSSHTFGEDDPSLLPEPEREMVKELVEMIAQFNLTEVK